MAAIRPKKSVMMSSVSACVMPATGVRPPLSRPTQGGDDEAGNHGSVKPTLGRQAACYRECDRQWDGDDSHDDARGEVRHELLAIVGLESGDELGNEQSGDPTRAGQGHTQSLS